jgi:hypothetical protein
MAFFESDFSASLEEHAKESKAMVEPVCQAIREARGDLDPSGAHLPQIGARLVCGNCSRNGLCSSFARSSSETTLFSGTGASFLFWRPPVRLPCFFF